MSKEKKPYYSEPTETPFSNGTSAMIWYDENCSKCTRAFFPKVDGQWPSEKTIRHYVEIGRECKMKHAIDIGFISGEVPVSIIDLIGRNERGYITDQCRMFSDNDDDRYKWPKKPKPEDPNQMVMPFLINEIDGVKVNQEVLTCTP